MIFYKTGLVSCRAPRNDDNAAQQQQQKTKKSARFSPGSLKCVGGSGILYNKPAREGRFLNTFALNAFGSRSPMANAFGAESLNKMVI